MAKTIQEEFLYKKVYEFSYAALRIASSFRTESSGRTSTKNREIAEMLEARAFSLLNSVLIADYEKTTDLVYSIISISGLLVDAGMLHPANKEILVRESESINLAIQALPKKEKQLPELNLNKIFSKSVLPIKRQSTDKHGKKDAQSAIGNVKSEIADKTIADKTADENSSFKSEIRQSAILNKLRQSENCRLNEIQALFPNISERTIRYDIESLVSRGLVERTGSRRNSVYSAKKDNLGAVIELPASPASMPPPVENQYPQ